MVGESGTRGDMRNAYRILFAKFEGNGAFGWVDNIKMDIKKVDLYIKSFEPHSPTCML